MSKAKDLLQEGGGILRLVPTWVPRSFCRPGKRIKLHPDDLYILGKDRGGIDERWFASSTWADNGPGTPDDEGLSYVVSRDGSERMLLRDVIEELKGALIGDTLWDKHHRFPVFAKFFDNLGPLPLHIHHRPEHAARVGQASKPEMYFFPAQMNNYGGEFPFTFFGLNPGTTKAQMKQALMNFSKGDNRILDLSHAHPVTLDTGWDVPAGILHAPASVCTYEPQLASDVSAMYQSMLLGDHSVSEDLLWKNCPPEELGNYDYLVDVIDWEANVDPDFCAKHFMKPKLAWETEGGREEWICYLSPIASAKRLTVLPGQSVIVKDATAYGLIMIQGHGEMNGQPLETPTIIRYGQLTNDEYFVSDATAKAGVTVTNRSSSEPLVMLKHFAENPDRPV